MLPNHRLRDHSRAGRWWEVAKIRNANNIPCKLCNLTCLLESIVQEKKYASGGGVSGERRI